MTNQFDIDCRHYGDRKLDTARIVDINDHQVSTEHRILFIAIINIIIIMTALLRLEGQGLLLEHMVVRAFVQYS